MANWQGQLNDKSLDYDYHDLGLRLEPGSENPPAWGCFLHPDEVRHVLLVGNSLLVTVNGEQLTNYHIKNWIDHNVKTLSNRLQHDIYPRLWRSRPVRMKSHERREIEPYAEWDDFQLFDGNKHNKNFHLRLRKRPVAKLHSWEIVSPFTGEVLIDLTDYAIIHYSRGVLQAALFNTGSYAGYSGLPISAWRLGTGNYAAAHKIDYSTGYDHASRVPEELKEVVMNQMIIDVMSAYGDGIVGGLANSSVSVGVLSESIGTTMSATSAYFGARIAEKQKWLDEWFKKRAPAYTGFNFKVL